MNIKSNFVSILVLIFVTGVQAQDYGYYPFPEHPSQMMTQVFTVGKDRFAVLPKEFFDQFGDASICSLSADNQLKICTSLNTDIVYDDIINGDNGYIFTGIIYNLNYPQPDTLVIELRSLNFDLISVSKFSLGKEFDNLCVVINDSIRIFAACADVVPKNFYEFVIPKDLDISKITIKNPVLKSELIFSLIESEDGEGYVCCFGSGVYLVDKHFNILKKLDTVKHSWVNSVVPALDSGYVCFGQCKTTISPKFTGLGITKIDKKMDYVGGDVFAYDVTAAGPVQFPIAKDNEHYYVAGMLGVWDNGINPYLDKTPNYFYIGKYDKDINRIWLKKHGGERHYFLNGIIADSLGGCCVYGFVREPGITDGKEGQAIPFIMCFNDQGELTSYTTPQLPEERLFSIKGNPAYTSITLGNIYGQSDYTYSIFDTNGHKVSAGVLNTDDAVLDVSKLSAGMYLLSIQNKDAKVVQVEKLVKQ